MKAHFQTNLTTASPADGTMGYLLINSPCSFRWGALRGVSFYPLISNTGEPRGKARETRSGQLCPMLAANSNLGNLTMPKWLICKIKWPTHPTALLWVFNKIMSLKHPAYGRNSINISAFFFVLWEVKYRSYMIKTIKILMKENIWFSMYNLKRAQLSKY